MVDDRAVVKVGVPIGLKPASEEAVSWALLVLKETKLRSVRVSRVLIAFPADERGKN